MKKICVTYQEYMNIYPLDINFETESDALYSVLNVIDYSDYEDNIKKLYMNDRIQYSGVDFDKYYDLNQIWIWPDYLVKQEADLEFESTQAYANFSRLHDDYFHKRWKEVPILKIFFDDFLALHKKFCELKKAKTKYIILTSYHFKDFDTVHIECKEELSAQDLEYFKREHEYFLKCEKARQKYRDNHPDYSFDKWRGPQDNEFNEDWQKFLDQD